MIYTAIFYGDIQYLEPMAGNSLNELLDKIRKVHGFGATAEDCTDCECSEAMRGNRCQTTPDPEDDKIEIWGFPIDHEERGQIVWGFWGWHWQKPEEMEQGKMPGDRKSLYERAMES